VTVTRQGVKAYWQDRVSSQHRSDSSEFYRRKASEHVLLMRDEDRNVPAVDYACGAGELLEHLDKLTSVARGVEQSNSMCQQARKRLTGTGITVVEAEGLEASRTAQEPVWMTCGGLNQYFNPEEMGIWFDNFAAQTNARSLYLFDTVDPARYFRLHTSSRFVSNRSRGLKSRLARLKNSDRWLVPTGRSHVRSIGRLEMGWAYGPPFFRALAEERGLTCWVCVLHGVRIPLPRAY
jgi:hypothetical protein